MQYLKQKQKKQTEKKIERAQCDDSGFAGARKTARHNGGDCEPIAAASIQSVNFWVAKNPH